MLEMLLPSAKNPYEYSSWIDLDFTTYPVGTQTGFIDKASNIAFGRTAGTGAIVVEDSVNCYSFNGDGTLSAGTIADMLLNNDFRITLEMKIKTGSTNPMLFLSRSTQGNGSGAWLCDILADARPDFWYNSDNSLRKTASTALPRGQWLTLQYESLSNKLYIRKDTTVLLNGAAIGNINNGSGFPLILGGSQDASLYHAKAFMRRVKIETKKRLPA